MKFISKYPGYQLIVRDEIATYNPTTQAKRLIKPVLTVDFGQFGREHAIEQDGVPMMSPFGQTYRAADVTGGLVDTEELAKERRWDAEDKQAVEEALLAAATDEYHPAYGDISIFEVPKTQAPWPTYDETPAEKISGLAHELGLTVPALFYEQATKARPEVLEALSAATRQDEELTAEDSELTAA